MNANKRYKVWILTPRAASVGAKSDKLRTVTWLDKFCRHSAYEELDPSDHATTGTRLSAIGAATGETIVMEKALLAMPGKTIRPHVLTMWEGEKGQELGREQEARVSAARRRVGSEGSSSGSDGDGAVDGGSGEGGGE